VEKPWALRTGLALVLQVVFESVLLEIVQTEKLVEPVFLWALRIGLALAPQVVFESVLLEIVLKVKLVELVFL
jgi:hypothetical protein